MGQSASYYSGRPRAGAPLPETESDSINHNHDQHWLSNTDVPGIIANFLLMKTLSKPINLPKSYCLVQFSSVAQSCPTLLPHGLQYDRPPCPSPTPRAYSNSCPSSCWCHPTISSSVVPFFSCLQSCPASGSFPVSQFFTSGDQRIGVSASASVLPMNI